MTKVTHKYKNPNGTFDEWTYEGGVLIQTIIRDPPKVQEEDGEDDKKVSKRRPKAEKPKEGLEKKLEKGSSRKRRE